MTKKSILKGTMIVSMAGLFARFIGLFFRVPLTAMIGQTGIGIYSFPMTLFIPLSAIVLQGPPTVIARMISEHHALGNDLEMGMIFQAGKALMFKLGISVSILMILLAPVLSTYIWSEEVLYPYLALSLAPLILGITSVYNGLYQGLQDMRAIAYQQLANGVGRLFFGLLLAHLLLRHGILYAATGAVLGTTIGSLTGMMAIIVFHKTHHIQLLKVSGEHSSVRDLQIKILKTAMPITIGAVGASLIPLVDSMLINNRLAKAGFSQEGIYDLNGILSNINALINVPLIIGVAISLSIIPNIAAAKVTDVNQLHNRMRSGMILAISLALPSGLGLFLVGRQVVAMFYPSMSLDNILVEILSLGIIFTMINQAFIAILQGTGHEKLPVKNFYLGLSLKFVLSYVLLAIPAINIHGAAISTLAAYIFILALNFTTCRRLLDFKVDVKYMILYPLMNTTIMALGVYGVMAIGLGIHAKIFTGLAIITGVGIYGILLVSTKVVRLKDIPGINRMKRK